MGRKRKGQFSVDDAELSNFSERRHFLKLLLSIISCPFALTKVTGSESGYSVIWLDLKNHTSNLASGQVLVSGQPGSLMKLVAAAALLEANLPSARKIIDCRGAVIVNGRIYKCLHPHGMISLTAAIGQSCNVFFGHAAKELSLPMFLHYRKAFGIHPPAIAKMAQKEMPNESVDYVLGLAKGFETTSWEILQMVGSIAQRGRAPSLEIASNTAAATPSVMTDFKDHTWNTLQEGMKLAGRVGTAKNLDPQNKLHVAVKTGTTIHGQKFQSWLAGYLPYDAPRYAFCLRAYAGTSGDQAIPLARTFLFAKTWT